MRITHATLFFILIACGALTLTAPRESYATTADELKEKIANKTDEIKKLEEEIETYRGQINTLGVEKKSLKALITSLDLTRKKLETDLKVTRAKTEATTLTIDQLESQIDQKGREIDSRHDSLSETLRIIQEHDTYSLPAVALSNDSFSGFWGDIETLSQFNETVQVNVALLKTLRTDLEDRHKQQELQKQKLLNLKEELGDRKKIIEGNKQEKTQLLTQTSNQESSYKKLLTKKMALKDAVAKELEDYEATLKFILDPSLFPRRGTYVFSPPLDNVLLTQHFGKTSASGRLYASGTHNGVDFRAPMGTQVKAMLGGTIMGVGDTDVACPGASFGRWVLIRHDNGLASIYAHLSLIKATAGSRVATGDVIGYSGTTGYSTGPHLHVSVYAASAVHIEDRPSRTCSGKIFTLPLAATNAYLDPLDYLFVKE